MQFDVLCRPDSINNIHIGRCVESIDVFALGNMRMDVFAVVGGSPFYVSGMLNGHPLSLQVFIIRYRVRLAGDGPNDPWGGGCQGIQGAHVAHGRSQVGSTPSTLQFHVLCQLDCIYNIYIG